jgi:hypothetical protein
VPTNQLWPAIMLITHAAIARERYSATQCRHQLTRRRWHGHVRLGAPSSLSDSAARVGRVEMYLIRHGGHHQGTPVGPDRASSYPVRAAADLTFRQTFTHGIRPGGRAMGRGYPETVGSRPPPQRADIARQMRQR